MARPKKNLSQKDWENVDYMCMIHCTGEEIAGLLKMDYDTLNRNCKEKFDMPISEYIKRQQAGGKMSLRRRQWEAAEAGNPTMLIWLGRQWLGQKEQQEISVTSNDETIREMNEYFKQKRNS